eukprot:7203123-Heterocapsa_arctica.AAC.1
MVRVAGEKPVLCLVPALSVSEPRTTEAYPLAILEPSRRCDDLGDHCFYRELVGRHRIEANR